MSTQPCGCDLEANWVCEAHRPAERLDGKLPKWERLDRAERFKARLAAADQMQDTATAQPPYGTAAYIAAPPLTPSEQFRAEAVARADAVQTRKDLLNRIATLENALALAQSREATRTYDLRYLLNLEIRDRQQFRERIAAITAQFYHAEHSLSSMQPIIALALELNPDLVERAR